MKPDPEQRPAFSLLIFPFDRNFYRLEYKWAQIKGEVSRPQSKSLSAQPGEESLRLFFMCFALTVLLRALILASEVGSFGFKHLLFLDGFKIPS